MGAFSDLQEGHGIEDGVFNIGWLFIKLDFKTSVLV
jgi:hypothetical protein